MAVATSNNTIEVLKNKIASLEIELENAQREHHALIDKTNQSLKYLFDNSNDLIIIFKVTGEIRFANDVIKKKLSYSEEEITDLKFLDLVHQDYRKGSLQNILKITAGSKFEKFETILISKTGKNIYVTGKMTSVFENEEPAEYRCVFYDITERIRAESAQSLYYQIANITMTESDLEQLYQNIYFQLNQMLRVKNFQINLRERNKYKRIFCINEKLEDQQLSFDVDNILMDYAFERGRSLIIYEDGIEKIGLQKGIEFKDPIPKIWLGVIITRANESGIVSVCSYKDQSSFNNKDLELLDYIAGQISLAMERQDKEEKIVNQAAALGAIFDSSTHEIWSVDKKLRFTSFNENYAAAFARYYDISPKIGESLQEVSLDMLSMERVKFWIEQYNKAFEGKFVNFQIKTKDKEGKMVWREVFINPIFLPDGRIEELSIIANDITEKKESESALIASEEKFRNIFESFQDIYFRCNMEGTITMISPSVQEVLGFSPEEMVGTNVMQYAAQKRQIFLMSARVISEERIRNIEGTINDANGNKLSFLLNIRLIEKDKTKEVEGVARDITQLRNTNKQLKKAKEMAEHSVMVKDRFLANMSHEIRTPMNGIIGMIDVLASTSLDYEQTEFVRTINRSSQTLMNILDDILDLSKIEAGKMELRSRPVDLVKTMKKVYSLYSQQAASRGHTLFHHVDPNIPKMILADETRLIQVISNLTSNAIKFCKNPGDINMSIQVYAKKGKEYSFKVSIKDSGIGISKEDQRSLFHSFHQLDNSSSKNFGGTGLGLAISKELVKLMKGEIGVVSTKGLGSTFWFTFKASEIEVENEKQVSSNELLTKQFIEMQPLILLVDDNEVNRKVASHILIKSGCKVIEAVDGFDAIEKASQKPFDLILMDIQMPKMDGTKVTEEIRKLDLKTCPPIIAMTAYSMKEDKERFLSAGLDDYLAKPIKADGLIQKVKDWVRFESAVEIPDNSPITQPKAQTINHETLDQLSKYGGRDLIESTFVDFNEEATRLIRDTILHFNASDFEKMKDELHTLKGNAGTLGVEKLCDQAAHIEKRLKENTFEGLKNEVMKLNFLFQEFKESFRNILITDE
ncbi:MAG: PAS domain S-box protein [Bacteroidota bacterium]